MVCMVYIFKNLLKLYSKMSLPIHVSNNCMRVYCFPPPHNHCIFLVFKKKRILNQCDKQNTSLQFYFFLVISEIEDLFKWLLTVYSSPSVMLICIHVPFFFWVIGLTLIYRLSFRQMIPKPYHGCLQLTLPAYVALVIASQKLMLFILVILLHCCFLASLI